MCACVCTCVWMCVWMWVHVIVQVMNDITCLQTNDVRCSCWATADVQASTCGGTNMTSTSIATEEIQQINSAVQLIRLQGAAVISCRKCSLWTSWTQVLMTYLLDWLIQWRVIPCSLSPEVQESHTSASRDAACTSWWSSPPTSPGSCDTDPSPAWSSCDSHVTSPSQVCCTYSLWK